MSDAHHVRNIRIQLHRGFGPKSQEEELALIIGCDNDEILGDARPGVCMAPMGLLAHGHVLDLGPPQT